MIELARTDDVNFQSAFAGDTLNTATYLARLAGRELDVHYVTVLGADANSDRMLAAWQREGIDTSLVARHPDRLPGIYVIENDTNGERKFFYWRSQSAARTLFTDECSVNLSSLAEFDCLYLSGITLGILKESVVSELFEFLQEFRTRGGTVVFDSNYRPALWRSRKFAADTATKMQSLATIALPSVDDELILHAESNEQQVIDRLLVSGAAEVVLKRGAAGARVFKDGAEVSLAKLPIATTVIDTTGAGDSFNAGYLAARLGGESIENAVAKAHAVALQVIAVKGAIVPI